MAAHLDKLSNFPPLKMHNSENVIGFSSTISGLVAVFKSLSFDDDLKIVNLLNQAVSRLCPNLKKAWSIQIVRSQWYRTFLLDFNEWLKEKAEDHKRLKTINSKGKSEEPVRYLSRQRSCCSKNVTSINAAYKMRQNKNVYRDSSPAYTGCVPASSSFPF